MRVLMSFIVAMVCTVPHLHAQRITILRADVDLRKDGSAVVTEKVTITGTAFLERSLPLLLTIGNNQWMMEINVLSVRDTSGNPLRYQALVRERHLDITVPLLPTAPFDQPQTVLLTYEVRHGVVVFLETHFYSFELTLRDDHEPPVPVDEVLVRVTVPADPQGGLSAYMYRGAEGPHITVEGRTVSLSQRNVPAGHWVGFSVSFPGRMVSLPMSDWFHQEVSLYLAGMVFMLALVGILFFYRRSTSENLNLLPSDTRPSVSRPAAAEPDALSVAMTPRCRICGGALSTGSQEQCASCIIDRDILSREMHGN